MSENARKRPDDSSGKYTKLHGEYRLAVQSGLVTVAAAATTTAGHMFVMRNPSTTKSVIIRYLSAQFGTTTAMTNQQTMGYDVIVARSFTASYTGGTAIDMGSTLTNSCKVRANQETSLFTANTCRIATTAGLTAGTQTLDAQPHAHKLFLSPVLGDVSPVLALVDARDDGASAVRSPITLGQDEGIVLRNTIVMGAVGVGYLVVNVEWDEVTL